MKSYDAADAFAANEHSNKAAYEAAVREIARDLAKAGQHQRYAARQ